MLTGGCSCGFVRYEAHGPVWHETLCHCSMCRRAAGAPVVAWFTVARDGFRPVAGTPARHRSSDHASRTFCPRCGTPLTFESDALPAEVDVTTCSLDEPEAVPPHDHTQAAMRLSWLRLDDGLPRFEAGRTDD